VRGDLEPAKVSPTPTPTPTPSTAWTWSRTVRARPTTGAPIDGVVRHELTEEGDHTILVFTHQGLSVRNAQGFLPGGHAFLDRLEAHLAGEEIPGWSKRYEEVAPVYT